MRPTNRNIDIFNLSMLDTISGALGAFLIIMLVLMRFHQPEVAKENVKLRAEAAQAREVIQTTAAQLEQAQQRLQQQQELEQQLEAARGALAEATSHTQQLEQRLGIALTETDLLFVLDISGSMGPTKERPNDPDLLSEIRSGLKMLVATMTEQYSIDLIFFPGPREAYGTMWGELRSVDEERKYAVYNYVAGLRSAGATPTREAMQVALGPQYERAKTIILLSDGAPCNPRNNACETLSRTQIGALVDELTSLNGGRKTINTIGVGAPFRKRDNSEDSVHFLRTLAERNNGFFIGF